jgi:hypothetical protein
MSDPPPKRRLPVIQPAEEGDEARPAAHWIAIGAVAVLLVWYPLAMLARAWANAKVTALSPEGDAIAAREAFQAMTAGERLWLNLVINVAPLVGLAVAATLGGMLVGRFGGEAGKNEGTFAGVAAGLIAALVSAPEMVMGGEGGFWLMTAVVITILAGITGRVGAALGVRLRR